MLVLYLHTLFATSLSIYYYIRYTSGPVITFKIGLLNIVLFSLGQIKGLKGTLDGHIIYARPEMNTPHSVQIIITATIENKQFLKTGYLYNED